MPAEQNDRINSTSHILSVHEAPQKLRSRGVVPSAPMCGALAVEGEDARLTGMTRSLQRRVMAMNFPANFSANKVA